MKKFAIITVDYNGHQDTVELLKSFSKLKVSKDFEHKWFVVDNGSQTPLLDQISENKSLEFIQTGINKGFTGGNNIGIRYASHWGADYFLLINNDTVFGDPKLIDHLVKATKDYPKAGLISPKIYFAPGFEFYKDRYTKNKVGKVIWYAGGTFDWLNVMSRHRGIDEVDIGQYNQTETTGFTTGCCVLIPRRIIDKVGVFDESYFAYFEDNDYQKRVLDAGFNQVYVGSTYIYHKVSRTSQIGSGFSDYMLTKNRLYFGMKYATTRTKLALIREAAKIFLLGRTQQRLGVIDWLKKYYGPQNPPQLRTDAKYSKRLSIVIINYRTRPLIINLLKSLYNPASGFDPLRDEVILLDNGSQDGCIEEVGKSFPQVKLIPEVENVGFPKGNNLCIEYSKGEHILLLNSDIEVLSGSITKLFRWTEKFNSKAVTVGKLQFPTGQYQDSCFDLPTVSGAFKEYYLKQKGSYFMFRPPDGQPTSVEGAVMACFLIPRQVFNRVGKLWSKAFTYFEDVDYCRRLLKQHIPIYFCPNAVFIHHHGATSKKIGQDRAYAMLKDASYKYHGFFNYSLLWLILWLGQKFSFVQTPKSAWAKSNK